MTDQDELQETLAQLKRLKRDITVIVREDPPARYPVFYTQSTHGCTAKAYINGQEVTSRGDDEQDAYDYLDMKIDSYLAKWPTSKKD